MIVNYTDCGWQVITQRSHGLLAAQICAYWRKDNQPERWVETLIAVAEHDDVYNELENEDLVNANGGPLNFKMTTFERAYATRLVAMAETKSAYVALLIAKHISFVHGEEPKAKPFLKELAKLEKAWLKVAQSTPAEVDRGYELLEFCDAFSLLICQGLIQPENRKIEISNGPDGTAHEMHTSGNGIVVAPWPFETNTFQVTWESRTLSELSFKSTANFRKAFKDTAAVTHRLTIGTGTKSTNS